MNLVLILVLLIWEAFESIKTLVQVKSGKRRERARDKENGMLEKKTTTASLSTASSSTASLSTASSSTASSSTANLSTASSSTASSSTASLSTASSSTASLSSRSRTFGN